MSSKRCACGLPELHYTSLEVRQLVERQVALLGANLDVTTPSGSWRVPRHYIAQHGLKAAEVPQLAALNGWERVA